MSERAHPRGNLNWEWRWMGFPAPELCYDIHPNISIYDKFKNCFNSFYGIGDFDYWIASELQKLSEADKVELIKLRLDDYNKELNKDTSQSKRKYIGLNEDGTINKSFFEFSNDRIDFWSILTIEECRNCEWPHNQRSRERGGFYCEDCNNYFSIDSEEYIRTEMFFKLSFDLYNAKVYYNRRNETIPTSLIELEEEYEALKNKGRYVITLDEINSIKEKIKALPQP